MATQVPHEAPSGVLARGRRDGQGEWVALAAAPGGDKRTLLTLYGCPPGDSTASRRAHGN